MAVLGAPDFPRALTMRLMTLQVVKGQLRRIVYPCQVLTLGHMTGMKVPKRHTSEDTRRARERVGAVTAGGGIVLRTRAPGKLTFLELVSRWTPSGEVRQKYAHTTTESARASISDPYLDAPFVNAICERDWPPNGFNC